MSQLEVRAPVSRLEVRSPMSGLEVRRRQSLRALLIFLAVSAAVPGLWATLAPDAFYASFPLGGTGWVRPLGPASPHFIADVGAFYLAFAGRSSAGDPAEQPQHLASRRRPRARLRFSRRQLKVNPDPCPDPTFGARQPDQAPAASQLA